MWCQLSTLLLDCHKALMNYHASLPACLPLRVVVACGFGVCVVACGLAWYGLVLPACLSSCLPFACLPGPEAGLAWLGLAWSFLWLAWLGLARLGLLLRTSCAHVSYVESDMVLACLTCVLSCLPAWYGTLEPCGKRGAMPANRCQSLPFFI